MCVCVVGILFLLKTVVALGRDEGVHWGIQNGLYLSRSTIVYFKHNDMESLRNLLEKVTQENKRAEKVRRYIVVEALYQVSFSRYVKPSEKLSYLGCNMKSQEQLLSFVSHLKIKYLPLLFLCFASSYHFLDN